MKLGSALLLLLAIPALAHGGCSRPLTAPVSPLGMSVIVRGQNVSGTYPTLFHDLGQRDGCEIRFTPVPRARQEALFETGRADLLIPASRTPRRDKFGYFIPLVASRAAIVSIDHARAPLRSFNDLLERKELRVALVRGFDYGDNYQALVKKLSEQGRVFFETDAIGVARLLNAGFADVSVLTPATIGGAILNDQRVTPMIDKLRIELVDDLPWGESGIYVSKTAVPAKDRAILEHMISSAVKSGLVWESVRKPYPPTLIEGTMHSR
jgi:polar amino acid transport system substrate-binding protein